MKPWILEEIFTFCILHFAFTRIIIQHHPFPHPTSPRGKKPSHAVCTNQRTIRKYLSSHSSARLPVPVPVHIHPARAQHNKPSLASRLSTLDPSQDPASGAVHSFFSPPPPRSQNHSLAMQQREKTKRMSQAPRISNPGVFFAIAAPNDWMDGRTDGLCV